MRQKGFTLIEVLVTTAVGGVILTGAVLGIYSVLVATGRSNNQVVALNDINRAALAIKYDLLMTQTTDFIEGVPKSSANLTWIDFTSSFGTAFQTPHSVLYALSGKQLRRTYDGVTSIVGRNITSVTFTQSARYTQSGAAIKAVTVVISSSNTAAPSGIETIRFSVHLRPEEIQ